MIGLEELQNLINSDTASQVIPNINQKQPGLLQNLFGGVKNYFGDLANYTGQGLKNPNVIKALNSYGMASLQGKPFGEAMATGFNTYEKAKNDLNNYNAYKPYFDNMGFNTDALNPAMGGGGFGEVSPLKLIEAQNNAAYKNALMNNWQNQQDNKNMSLDDINKIRMAIQSGDLGGLGSMQIPNAIAGSIINFKPESGLAGNQLTGAKTDLTKAQIPLTNARTGLTNQQIITEQGKPSVQQAQINALNSGIPIKQQQANTSSFNALIGGVKDGVIDPNSVDLPNINSFTGVTSLPPVPNLPNIPIPNPKPLPTPTPKPKINSNFKGNPVKVQENVNALNAVSSQLKRFENTFNVMPSKSNALTSGQFRKITGTQTPGEVNFEAQKTLLFNKIARELGGEKGVLSDGDIARIKASLPELTDSKAQKQAKMNAINALLQDRYSMYQKNPQAQASTSSQSTVQSLINKYKGQ